MLLTDPKVKPKMSITRLYITDNLFASVTCFTVSLLLSFNSFRDKKQKFRLCLLILLSCFVFVNGRNGIFGGVRCDHWVALLD